MSVNQKIENESKSSTTTAYSSESEVFIVDEVGSGFVPDTGNEDPEVLVIKQIHNSATDKRKEHGGKEVEETIQNSQKEGKGETVVKEKKRKRKKGKPQTVASVIEQVNKDNGNEVILEKKKRKRKRKAKCVQTDVPDDDDQQVIILENDGFKATKTQEEKDEPEILLERFTENKNSQKTECSELPEEGISGETSTTDVDGIFCLDTTPEVSKKKTLGPRFRSEFTTTLKFEEDDVDVESEKANNKSANRCFNCQGEHSLVDCQQPRNSKEIAKNRALFLQSQPKFNKNRYHIETPSKFAHFKPGVISEDLREALGLRKYEIPLHVYQMRIMGYPPGWLEHAKEYSSGLQLINCVKSPSKEEKQTLTYDYDRIIDFPGFNVALDSKFRDEWQHLNFPPMQHYHSKKNFIEQLQKRCEREASILKEDTGANVEIVDMDTSIEELEEQRQELLARLNGSGGDSSDDSSSSSPDKGKPSSSTKSEEKEESHDPVEEGKSKTESEGTPRTDQIASPKQSRLLAMGTPVSLRHSPYNSLPSLDKFAHNMGDLELFENLPNSTGAFQKVRSLLEKVRKRFQKK